MAALLEKQAADLDVSAANLSNAADTAAVVAVGLGILSVLNPAVIPLAGLVAIKAGLLRRSASKKSLEAARLRAAAAGVRLNLAIGELKMLVDLPELSPPEGPLGPCGPLVAIGWSESRLPWLVTALAILFSLLMTGPGAMVRKDGP